MLLRKILQKQVQMAGSSELMARKKALLDQLVPVLDEIERMEKRLSRKSHNYDSLFSDCEKLKRESLLMKRQLQEINNIHDLPEVDAEERVHWSTVSFHRFKVRVGEDFRPKRSVIAIDESCWPSSDHHGPAATSGPKADSTVDSTRTLIQRGVLLCHEDKDVYAECLCDSSLFVHSVVCNQLRGVPWDTVIEIPTGSCVQLFSYKEFARLLNEALRKGPKEKYEAVRELTGTCSIRMSFGGMSWGPGRERKEVTSTPCWIHMQLREPTHWFKKILAHIGPPALTPSPAALTPPLVELKWSSCTCGCVTQQQCTSASAC